jgi:hypothetical protein
VLQACIMSIKQYNLRQCSRKAVVCSQLPVSATVVVLVLVSTALRA